MDHIEKCYKRGKGRHIKSMIVITFATDDQGYFQALKSSCAMNNLELVVLGWGEKWTGFLQKPRMVADYIRKLDPMEMIVVVDAFDVIILQNADEIQKRFDHLTRHCDPKSKPQVVIGVDNVNGPWIYDLFSFMFFRTACWKRPLCMGVQIGSADVMLRIFEIFKDAIDNEDDQVILNRQCTKIKDSITVDDSGYLIYNSCVLKSLYKNTNKTKPCVVHAPGYKQLFSLSFFVTFLDFRV